MDSLLWVYPVLIIEVLRLALGKLWGSLLENNELIWFFKPRFWLWFCALLQEWPNGSLSRFQDSQTLFFLRCKDLSLRVLKLMAHSLDLDPDLFLSAHRLVGSMSLEHVHTFFTSLLTSPSAHLTSCEVQNPVVSDKPTVSPAASENGTTLRSLYYPPVDSEKIKQDQLRCGEHSDYGSITLLFQSSEGLQVTSPLCHDTDILKPQHWPPHLICIGEEPFRWLH